MRMQPAGGIRMSKAWNKKSAPHGYRDEAKRNRDERACAKEARAVNEDAAGRRNPNEQG